jgi:hypothetical protein
MELTKEHFDKQLKGLVRKSDLDKRFANVATKSDLKNFATKDDLRRFATKDDLLELVTKNDLGSVRDDVEAIKKMVTRIDQRTDEDTRALMRDVGELRRRVSVLERG